MSARPAPARPAPERATVHRPRSAAAVRAELVESDSSWRLTLHCDAATAAVLRAAGIGIGPTQGFSVSVTPNLVPGEPFDVADVVVTVD